jgi:predicted nucleic acid-binding protein
MIVPDASVVVDMLTATGRAQPLFDLIARAGGSVDGPELLPIELVHVLRRFQQRGALTDTRATIAVRALHNMPISYHRSAPLIDAGWRLRHRLSAYDATYVALAGALGATLVTRDARIARSHGLDISVLVV